jgi:hypothetical protein
MSKSHRLESNFPSEAHFSKSSVSLSSRAMSPEKGRFPLPACSDTSEPRGGGPPHDPLQAAAQLLLAANSLAWLIYAATEGTFP